MEPEQAELTTLHVRRAVEGSNESLGWLVEHFDPLVRAQVRLRLGPRGHHQADVDDVTAEVWAVVLARASDVRPRSGRFTPVFVSFLGSTARNLCNAHLRRIIRARTGIAIEGRASSAGDGMDRLCARTRGVLTRVGQHEVRDAIEAALERLDPARREVLVLRLLEQLSNTEIAARQGVSANTVAVRYRRALNELRQRLPTAVRVAFADLIGGAPEESQ